MDLKPFVGKKVLLQLKPQTAYVVVTRVQGHLAPLLMQPKQEAPAEPVIVPYIDGRIEEDNGCFFLVYSDMAARPRKAELRVAISPDLIGFVTVHGEEQTSSVILAP